MAGAFKRHLPTEAFWEMNISMIIDYMTEYNDMFYSQNESSTDREATQSDFDRF